MKKIVQLCSFESVYNQNLINELDIISDKTRLFVNDSIDYTKELDTYDDLLQDSEVKVTNKNKYWDGFVDFMSGKYSYNPREDIVVIQYAYLAYKFMIPWFKKNFKRTILVIWGSDLLARNKEDLLFLDDLFHYVDAIVVETEEMKNIFIDRIGTKYVDKIRYAKFGLPVLKLIDSISEDNKNDFRKKNGIDGRKTVLMVGYNGYAEQRHINVIESLHLSGVSREDVFLVFPWTYGNSDVNYKRLVMSSVKDKYDYVFLEQMLSWDEIACLRTVADIFIHVRLTDSNSATMLETLYAEKCVIAGKWFPYKELFSRGITMETIDDISDVGAAVQRMLEHPYGKEQRIRNKEIVYEWASWEHNIKNWLSILDICGETRI